MQKKMWYADHILSQNVADAVTENCCSATALCFFVKGLSRSTGCVRSGAGHPVQAIPLAPWTYSMDDNTIHYVIIIVIVSWMEQLTINSWLRPGLWFSLKTRDSNPLQVMMSSEFLQIYTQLPTLMTTEDGCPYGNQSIKSIS